MKTTNTKKNEDREGKKLVVSRVKAHSSAINNVLAEYNITARQELFCQYYTSPTEFYGNGTQSYLAAYGLDSANFAHYNSAKTGACGLLVKPNVLRRIDSLLNERGFNDSNADKQLLFLMLQNADLSTKLGALREYNKLKQRITLKVDHNLNTPVTGIRIIKVDTEMVKQAQALLADKNEETNDRQQRNVGDTYEEESFREREGDD